MRGLFFGHGQNFDHPDVFCFREGEHIPCPDLAMRFGHGITIKPQPAAGDQALRIGSCFENRAAQSHLSIRISVASDIETLGWSVIVFIGLDRGDVILI